MTNSLQPEHGHSSGEHGQRRAHPFSYVMEVLDLKSRQSIYALHSRGELKISKVLSKSVVFDEDLKAYIAKQRGEQ